MIERWVPLIDESHEGSHGKMDRWISWIDGTYG